MSRNSNGAGTLNVVTPTQAAGRSRPGRPLVASPTATSRTVRRSSDSSADSPSKSSTSEALIGHYLALEATQLVRGSEGLLAIELFEWSQQLPGIHSRPLQRARQVKARRDDRRDRELVMPPDQSLQHCRGRHPNAHRRPLVSKSIELDALKSNEFRWIESGIEPIGPRARGQVSPKLRTPLPSAGGFEPKFLFGVIVRHPRRGHRT